MMEFSPLFIVTGLLGGVLLGALYFGGLWLSVKRIGKVEHKKMFLFLSWLVRSVLLCGGLYLLARYNPASLLCGVFGLFLSRTIIVRTVKRKIQVENAKEMPAC